MRLSPHPSDPVRVTVAHPEDYAEIAAVNEAAYTEYRPVLGEAVWAPMRANITAVAEAAKAAVLLAARGDDGVLGSVLYYPPGTSLPPLPPEYASIRTLAVAPRARGRGVGAALMQACIERARAEGADRLWLYTTEMMSSAVALYERLGFVRDAEMPPRHGQRCWSYRLDLGTAGGEATPAR
ncbi:MAG TPA: GNAT family N-acetyltransferase [Longimicrobium sp.]|jgi:ribosomal protein S18 acetylase RimI-like enzyme